MSAYLLTDHLFNFIAPAACMALLMLILPQFLGRVFKQRKPEIAGWKTRLAIIFIVNVVILATGLVIFGVDGKMVTYIALVLGSAVCHWILCRGWKA